MKSSHRILTLCSLAAMLLGVYPAAQASVVVSGTRLIYPAKQHDITIQLTNTDTRPALVQSWIDSGDARQEPSQSTAPFVVTPPITRVDAGKKQLIRMTYLGSSALPSDRESVFWYNMLDVPPDSRASADKNSIQVALRTRIKVFYRPDGLPGSPEKAASELTWQAVNTPKGYALRAVNPSAFNVSMSNVAVTVGGKAYSNETGGMVPPKGSQDFILKGLNGSPSSQATVTYSWINDFGSQVKGKSTVRNN
ncbi:fimbria/pilus periplasmic chaperone [Buttiauxella selenatireducens]|uniref:Fimbria/pilus periplasmic chaperone n=1 Tax=Buttiauxella selenatireducens TaxID=3073902 RepID=A0ABY9SFM2_9ENTR|nr:fimbria/pilus periplasmic chaperone [Buttiauxella sp. R73]WMY75941.1 fimbria/pilus periplasmic chaperone [Buttiauxella sp. R73]